MLVKGLAADDRIRLYDDGQFELLSWGRNVAVQVFGEWGEIDALAQHIASIGGRLDGKEPRVRVFTVPLEVGVHKIEATIDNVVKDWPQLTWSFGNLSEIVLLLGTDESDEPLHEHVYAFANPNGSFELVVSPLLVTGVASGDVITVAEGGEFALVEQNGNVAVQAFGDWDLEFFTPIVEDVGGRLDANAGGHVAAFTFPPVVERSTIATMFDAKAADRGDSVERSWRFANLDPSHNEG